jgi:hypothetical protein
MLMYREKSGENASEVVFDTGLRDDRNGRRMGSPGAWGRVKRFGEHTTFIALKSDCMLVLVHDMAIMSWRPR